MDEQEIIKEFRKMVEAEKNLISCTETNFLLKFLRVSDFDSNKSLQLLRNYYKLRLNYAHLYVNFTPKAPKMMTLWNSKFATFFPVPDQNGRTLLFIKLGNWDPLINTFDDIFICLQILFEVLIANDEEAQKNGVVIIVDMHGIGLGHAKQIVPSNVRKCLSLIEDSFPLWFHAFHLINQNAIFKMIFTLILPILSKNMREKIFLYGRNLEKLYQQVNPSLLPECLGGSMPLRNHDEEIQLLFKYEEYLFNINRFGYKKV